MAPRKTSTANQIDPVVLTSVALKAVRCASEYHRLVGTAERAVLESAWNKLSESEQSRITGIVNDNIQPDPQTIADELAACGTLFELRATKASYGDVAVKSAWKLLPVTERDRLTRICQGEPQPVQETPAPVTEQPAAYHVESQAVEQPQTKTRTLFTIGDDLEKLNELLDDCGDDYQQQEFISHWLEQTGAERDKKLDGYCALITEMQARAEVRKAEAKRLAELAASDEGRARLLKDRLKTFFEQHDIKTVQTPRYKLSLSKNGGKAPLILNDSVPATQLPEQFQRVSIDPDTAAIRAVLEAGEQLTFARLGERGASIRIK